MLEQSAPPQSGTGKSEATAARSSFTPPLVVFLVGLVLTVALFVIVMRNTQEEELQRTYQKEALFQSVVLGRSIEHALDGVAAIRGLYAASNSVERDEFRAYADQILLRNRKIQALEWIPRVPAEERAAYEAAARSDNLVDFRITERNSSGDMVAAAARSEYFPVYFVAPLVGNEAALGFDLASDPSRREALDRARDTGKIVTTQKIQLVQDGSGQFGFLAFAPIYSIGTVPETVDMRRETLIGFALGVFRIDTIIQSAIGQTHTLSELDLYVLDSAAPAGEALLYNQGVPGQDRSVLSEAELLLGGYEKIALSVADRNWLVIFVPPTEVNFPASAAPWFTAGFGFLLSVFFVLFLRSTQNRAHIIGQTVIERTAELSTVNQALVDEMAERQTAEKLLQEQNETLQLINTLTVDVDMAKTIDDAIQICLEEICAFTGWPIGHAFLPSEDNPEIFVSAGG